MNKLIHIAIIAIIVMYSFSANLAMAEGFNFAGISFDDTPDQIESKLITAGIAVSDKDFEWCNNERITNRERIVIAGQIEDMKNTEFSEIYKNTINLALKTLNSSVSDKQVIELFCFSSSKEKNDINSINFEYSADDKLLKYTVFFESDFYRDNPLDHPIFKILKEKYGEPKADIKSRAISKDQRWVFKNTETGEAILMVYGNNYRHFRITYYNVSGIEAMTNILLKSLEADSELKNKGSEAKKLF